MRTLYKSAAMAAIMSASVTANAQDDTAQDIDYFDQLKACQTIADDTERLACFDKSVGSIVTASDSGEVRVIDKEDAEKTRRSLFGFSLPNLGIFGGGDDESDEAKKKRSLLETTITSVHYSKPDEVYFVTTEGATWRITNAPSRLREVRVGQSVVLKQASMGSFFIRVDGQLGVKGRRVR